MPTKRTATVAVENQTGGNVVTIHVVHKYSDNYSNQKHFGGNWNNGETTSDKLTVEYNTGAFTTGRDWWYVAFTMDDGSFYQSDPANCRKFIDGLETVGVYATNIICGLGGGTAVATGAQAAGAASAGYSGIAACYAAYGGAVGLASAIGLVVANTMMNTESTAGFKQHILRSDDEHKVTTIVIRKNEVVFKSKSGISTTGVKRSN